MSLIPDNCSYSTVRVHGSARKRAQLFRLSRSNFVSCCHGTAKKNYGFAKPKLSYLRKVVSSRSLLSIPLLERTRIRRLMRAYMVLVVDSV